jgi:hypothetical protein
VLTSSQEVDECEPLLAAMDEPAPNFCGGAAAAADDDDEDQEDADDARADDEGAGDASVAEAEAEAGTYTRPLLSST